MSLYLRLFNQMLEENKELFNEFKQLNQDFDINKSNPEFRLRFNKIGEKILDIIRRYENILCSRTESNASKYIYSSRLSEMFWKLARKNFKYIDEVGMC
ncbi:MAG: hypothetical protein NZZ41_04970 [Candidatus Dojkabacteria bacterium]|nr:hypothetical protein [Candidatus Dojkabacteria bacterium]